MRFKVARKWHCVECFAQSGKRSERSVDGADDLSIDDQRIVSELRKRSRSASALQQEAEELRAVRQCVREWSKNYGECETKKDAEKDETSESAESQSTELSELWALAEKLRALIATRSKDASSSRPHYLMAALEALET